MDLAGVHADVNAEASAGHAAAVQYGFLGPVYGRLCHIDADVCAAAHGLEVEDGVGIEVQVYVAGHQTVAGDRHGVVLDDEVVLEVQPGVRVAHAHGAAIGSVVVSDGAAVEGGRTRVHEDAGAIDSLVAMALLADGDAGEGRYTRAHVDAAAVAILRLVVAHDHIAAAHGDRTGCRIETAAAAAGGCIAVDRAGAADADGSGIGVDGAAVLIRGAVLDGAAGHGEGAGIRIHGTAAAGGGRIPGHETAGNLHRTVGSPNSAAVRRAIVRDIALHQSEGHAVHMESAAADVRLVMRDADTAAVDVHIGDLGIDGAAEASGSGFFAGERVGSGGGDSAVILDGAAGDISRAGSHIDGAATLGGVTVALHADGTAADIDAFAACIVDGAAFGSSVVLQGAAADVHFAGLSIDSAALDRRAAGNLAIEDVHRAPAAVHRATLARGHGVLQDRS